MTITTHSAEETQQVAKDFAVTLKGGEVVSLIGDLGAGKTTFVRGLVGALGGTARVKSPTFTVMNEYPVDAGAIRRIVHIDFYRFENEKELPALSLEDERRPDTVIVAEWPNVFREGVISPNVVIAFTHLGEDGREITVSRQ